MQYLQKMMSHRAPHTILGVLLAFAFLLILGGSEMLCASDDDCGSSGACGNEEGCALCGCSCHVPTVLLADSAPECPLAHAGAVVASNMRPSDGIPVSIVRPPA